MAVTVIIKACGGEVPGKFASIQGDTVVLYFGIKPDRHGGYHGSGKKLHFAAEDVEVIADQPEMELSRGALARPAWWVRWLFPDRSARPGRESGKDRSTAGH